LCIFTNLIIREVSGYSRIHVYDVGYDVISNNTIKLFRGKLELMHMYVLVILGELEVIEIDQDDLRRYLIG
jgi:hypothetical protein